ncbi:23S rRNA (guanosine(2251)-2'-O)-methyltransferase RlmB [Olsenella sp. Marseille-P4559]|uniref:23S rRNA (guanosine(2251)-2'-O)-methyltransferase RlmB n=1 Tax=Olsenella sp. Marseille-P4559 TaxID=2364795 RepID=UPI001030CFA0|nr:23S rRNA (guanosine(2251)-2'-O)-methyltransferase RlmB [Olsenella sp. Marseille-P4559]
MARGDARRGSSRRGAGSAQAGRGGQHHGRSQRSGSRPGNGAPRGRQGRGGRDQRDRHGRRDQGRSAVPGSDVIEGRRAVAEALDAGIPICTAFVQDGAGSPDGTDKTLGSLVRRLVDAGVECESVPRSRLDRLSSHGAHQGIVVRTKPFSYATIEDVIAAAGEGDALVVVLDHVTDEGNFGAIVRSAEVVGAAGVVVANARAATVGPGAYKTSAGAVLHLPIAQVPNLARAIDQLKDAGFWACAATEHAEQSVWHAPVYGRLALVMGSEGVGISRLVLDHCDFGARLPQRGRVESLNVAQATTVMCYEWLRRVSEGAQADA